MALKTNEYDYQNVTAAEWSTIGSNFNLDNVYLNDFALSSSSITFGSGTVFSVGNKQTRVISNEIISLPTTANSNKYYIYLSFNETTNLTTLILENAPNGGGSWSTIYNYLILTIDTVNGSPINLTEDAITWNLAKSKFIESDYLEPNFLKKVDDTAENLAINTFIKFNDTNFTNRPIRIEANRGIVYPLEINGADNSRHWFMQVETNSTSLHDTIRTLNSVGDVFKGIRWNGTSFDLFKDNAWRPLALKEETTYAPVDYLLWSGLSQINEGQILPLNFQGFSYQDFYEYHLVFAGYDGSTTIEGKTYTHVLPFTILDIGNVFEFFGNTYISIARNLNGDSGTVTKAGSFSQSDNTFVGKTEGTTESNQWVLVGIRARRLEVV